MDRHCPLFFRLLSLLSVFLLIQAQQPYIRKTNTDCSITDNSTSILGYTCNGETTSCQSYLIFRSQPPYNSVSSISRLLASDPVQLSEVNAVSVNSTFETNREVIVPVNCSCSGEFYQANSTYAVQSEQAFFLIANDTFQGLSTCHAMEKQNQVSTRNLFSGTRVNVPLRCACPTKNQTDAGWKYLLSYIITWGDFVRSISERFGVDTGSILAANEISEQAPNIYPFTTLLIPLQDTPNSQTIAPAQPSPPLPPSQSLSPPSPPSSGKKNTWVYILVGVIGVVVVSIVTFCVFVRKGRRKTGSAESPGVDFLESKGFESYEKTNGNSVEESEEFLASITGICQSVKVYKFSELQSATQNFSPKCLVKGSVYHGTINGSLAAIKRTNKDVAEEIKILNKINHFNLIKLSGVCFNEGYWYQVFEYAENGSLTDWIYYSKSTRKVLNWSERIQIALDVASGLNYIHSYINPPHIHRDVKTSNVLLDSDFRAKIANFSLAQAADGQDGKFALTRHIVGTQGFMAPEYLENGYVSTKLDVYSFGIVMLELLTGEETAVASEAGKVASPEALTATLSEEKSKSKLEDLIDPSLRGKYPLDLALLLARLIESCLKRDPAGRPTMEEVVQTLSYFSTTSNWEDSNDDFEETMVKNP